LKRENLHLSWHPEAVCTELFIVASSEPPDAIPRT
jgi:hypothetical protein